MGRFHGDGQRVLASLIHCVLIGSSLQQQAHLSKVANERVSGVELSSYFRCEQVCVQLPSVTSGGSSVQRPLTSPVSVVNVGSILQQELAGQQRPLQEAKRNNTESEPSRLQHAQTMMQ